MSFEKKTNTLLKIATTNSFFGEKIQYLPQTGGTSFFAQGIFDNQAEIVDPDTEEVIRTRIPNVGFREKDLGIEAEQGDKLVVRNIQYIVTDVIPDGNGGVTLMLNRDE